MNIEDFREYCLSLPGVHDDFPFGKASSEYDRNLLVFYVGEKWFCFVNAVEFDRCNLKSDPDAIAELRARYEGILPAYHMNKRHWMGVSFHSDVPDGVIRALTRRSYDRVAGSLTRRQREAAGLPSAADPTTASPSAADPTIASPSAAEPSASEWSVAGPTAAAEPFTESSKQERS